MAVTNPIMRDLRSGEFARVYLLYGEEGYLRRFYRNKLRDALTEPGNDINLNIYKGKDIDIRAVIDQADTMPFFAQHRVIIIEDSELFSTGESPLAEYIPRIPDETVIIFSEEKVDKRSRLFKACTEHGTAFECRHMKEEDLRSWILRRLEMKGRRIQREAMDVFFRCIGDDLDGIENEIDKLVDYTLGREGISADDVLAVCSIRMEDQVFKMIDAIIAKDQKRAMRYYRDLAGLRTPPLRILGAMGSQFTRLLQIRDLREQGYDRAEIISRTGLKSFIVNNALSLTENIPPSSLKKGVAICVDADESIKRGKLGAEMALEIAISECCRIQ